MNKTKILTSLSALAAVFVFNGDAMSAEYTGVYNPSCDGNQYTLTYVQSDDVEDFWEQFESNDCNERGSSGDGTCVPVGSEGYCPALDSEIIYTYGTGMDLYLSNPDGCVSYETVYSFTGWKVKSTTSGVNFEKTLAKNETMNDAFFQMSDGSVVPDGTKFEISPANVTLNGYDFTIECTNSSEYVPSSVALGTNETAAIEAGVPFDLTSYCNVNGYTITGWEYKVVSGMTAPAYAAVADPSKFTIKGNFADDAIVYARPKYAAKSYTVKFLKKDNTVHDTLTYTNPGKAGNDAAWKRGGAAATTANLPSATGYVLRAMCTNTVADVTQNTGAISTATCGTMVTRSTTSATVSSALPKNWVLTADRTFKSVWANDCAPAASAVCSVSVTASNGAVEYCNACMAGYNKEGLLSLESVNEEACPADH